MYTRTARAEQRLQHSFTAGFSALKVACRLTPSWSAFRTLSLMANLEDLSAEILEMIVSRLDFEAMCNMRLVSRGISMKASHGIVESDFQAESLVWTWSPQVQDLAVKTAKGWRNCLMSLLTIIGVVGETAVPDAWKTEIEASLAQIFANMKRNAPSGFLESLALRVQGHDREGQLVDSGHVHGLNLTWEESARTFATTMNALASSGMLIQRLDLFESGSPRCALACNRLSEVLQNPSVRIRTSFRTLTHLSVGLSNALATQCPTGHQTHVQPSDALLNLVISCPSLKSLKIRWYKLGDLGAVDQAVDATILSQLVSSEMGHVSLHRLQECHLRGVYTTETDLLAFSRHAMHLHSLSLEEVHLIDGTFEPVFQHLVGDCTLGELQELYLDDLWEAEAHIRFDARGKPHFPFMGDLQWPHDLVWKETSRRRKVKYRHSKGVPMGSVDYFNWRMRRNAQFGPPYAGV